MTVTRYPACVNADASAATRLSCGNALFSSSISTRRPGAAVMTHVLCLYADRRPAG